MLTCGVPGHARLRGPGTPDMLTWLSGQSGLESTPWSIVLPRYSGSCTLISFTTEDFAELKESPLPYTDGNKEALRESIASRFRFSATEPDGGCPHESHTGDTKAWGTDVRPARRPRFWFDLIKQQA